MRFIINISEDYLKEGSSLLSLKDKLKNPDSAANVMLHVSTCMLLRDFSNDDYFEFDTDKAAHDEKKYIQIAVDALGSIVLSKIKNELQNKQ